MTLIPIVGALIGGAIGGIRTKDPENQLSNILKGAVAGGTAGIGLGGIGRMLGANGIKGTLGAMYGGSGGKLALGMDVFGAATALGYGMQDGELSLGDWAQAATPFIGTAVGGAFAKKRMGQRGLDAANKAATAEIGAMGIANADEIAKVQQRHRELAEASGQYDEWEPHPFLGVGADVGLGMLAARYVR